MNKYTSGEWSIAPHSATYQVVGEGAERLRKFGLPTQFDALSVGTAHGQVAIVPLDESSIDNAKLITAAPDLLEALKAIIHCPVGPGEPICRTCVENAHAAINKAGAGYKKKGPIV